MTEPTMSPIVRSRAENAVRLIEMASLSGEPLRRAQLLAEAQAQVAWTLRAAVGECTDAGVSWAKIGEAVGMPRESIFRQFSTGAPIVALKPVQTPTSPNMKDPRNQSTGQAIFAFQTPDDGVWRGSPALLPEGQHRMAALPFNPPMAIGSDFAGQMLMVRYGEVTKDVSAHYVQVVESDGNRRPVRMTYEVFNLLFGDGQTPLRRAMTDVVHAVLSNELNPAQLREVVGRAAKAMNPGVPLAEFAAAVNAVIETRQGIVPTDASSDEAIRRLKRAVAEFEAWSEVRR
ncbi:hypothetical protein [Arthrobacter sp. 2MCAF14]|uniref:hypothetical protein n=1 Tax=Arthrobacter sp. 2MCAF14 TaxID=3232982 RepID=UPI003F92F647